MALSRSLVNGPQSTVLTQRSIAWEHWIIHRGEYFAASDRRDLANNSSLNYLIRTGVHGVHMDIAAWSAGAIDLDVHSAPVLGSPFSATEMDITNHALPLTGIRVPECTFFMDVDIDDDGGNPALQRFIPIGSGGEVLNQAAGREFVLGPKHDYLVHVDNLSNGAIRYSIEFNFYEVLL